MRRLTVALALIAALGLVPAASAWTWPLGGDVLRPYSLGPDAYAAGQHRGVDVAGAGGESVRAPASGTVSFGGVVPGSGRTVTIQLDGYAVSLTHLGEISVVKGATVAEGQTIGVAGQSGDAEWPMPYVHLGIRVSAAADGYVDPATLLPPRGVVPPPAVVAPVAAPVAVPVVAPGAVPVVAPVPVPAPVVVSATVPVASPGPAAGSSLPPAPSQVAVSDSKPSPVARVSPPEPVSVAAPHTPVFTQPTINPSTASTSVHAAPGAASTAHRPPVVATGGVTPRAEQPQSLAAESPRGALPAPRAGSPANASLGPPAEPGVSESGVSAAATESERRDVARGASPVLPGRRKLAREGGISGEGDASAEPVDRVLLAMSVLSGGRKQEPHALSASARKGSTTVGTLSLVHRGRRLAVAAPPLVLVALGAIWLLARIRRLDRDGVVLRYRRALLGRPA